MRRSILFFCFIAIFGTMFAQPTSMVGDTYTIANILTPEEEAMLRTCPTLKINAIHPGVTLPSAVDNSQLPYMSPIYGQSALECGQASSIAYTFSYELNRRRGLVNDNDTRRYATHFAWNFCNGGSSRGVSFMDTWAVVRDAGTPNIADWGGWYTTGGPSRWATGYNLYYKAMKNRIVEFMAIPTDTEEGILVLKHWLDNHLCGDETGGLANFYSTHVPNGNEEMLRQIPAGTPHAGMWIVPNFKSNVNHGQTIVGYDDSICWDYNGDGRYTNDEDLNYDGVVDVHDWEVGAVIFCNSFGTAFANDGYCYLPYRKLAELPAEGGIWNKCVYVVNVKDVVTPKITYKINLTHDSRNKIKVVGGVAQNVNATVPEHTIEWSVFNFQGGDLYMQGGDSEADKTIEFGLDASRLLEYIEPNTPAKFFLQVVEIDDVTDTTTGQVNSFVLYEYNGSQIQQHPCSQNNVPIVNNGTTTLSLTAGINFSRPQLNTTLPTMEAYTPYGHQLTATGGTAPYRYEFTKEYKVEEFSGTMPAHTGNNANLTNMNSGYVLIDLPFEFPYYESKYSQVCLYADGYLSFRYDTYNWPFLQNAGQQVRATEMIAPFRSDLSLTSVKVTRNNSIVTLSVQGKMAGQNSSSINYVVNLYPDGIIEFYYGSMSYSGNDVMSLISRGDTRIIQRTAVDGASAGDIANRCFRFTPTAHPDFITLTRDGLLEGMATQAFTNLPVSITCFDINDQRIDTTLMLNCEYGNMLVFTNVDIQSGGDDIVSPGEDVSLSLTVKNLDSAAFNNCNITFSTASPYIQMIDNEEYFGYINGGNSYTLNNAIRFHVAPETPHLTTVDFIAEITNDRYPMTQVIPITIYSHDIQYEGYDLIDNNDHLISPNEIDTLYVVFKNAGDNPVSNLHFELRMQDPAINVLNNSFDKALLEPNESVTTRFVFYTGSNYENQGVVDALIDITTDGMFYGTTIITILNANNCEDFEDGLPDGFSTGDAAWFLTDETAASGNHSLRSAVIDHNGSTDLICEYEVIRDGLVSFYYKTSTENNYDWLYFYIDDVQLSRWSGTHDWTHAAFPVQAGHHTFRWTYSKDYSVSNGSDCVWVDEVCFPLDNDATPELQITPGSVSVTTGWQSVDVPLEYTSLTPIHLIFENEILNNTNSSIGWASVDYPNGSLGALASRTINLNIHMQGMPDGIYRADLVATVEEGNTVTVPIEVVVAHTDVAEYAADTWNIKVYPNPTSDAVQVEVERAATDQPLRCRLFDMSGRLLRDFHEMDDTFSVNLSDYAAGFYFLQITTDDGSTRQVVKIAKR
ncbi:MAG: T9SS type A sorting domain-containing protein [Bacteroidales bacterium]|nr:T9SS type A sorting domain-containing protein [Bacteroidales bacterium]